MTKLDESLFDEYGNYIPDAAAGPWAIYIGHFPSPFGLFVKFGMSATPVNRLWGIHSNSPYPLETFSWAWCGCRKTAALGEKTVRLQFAAERTRGEWYRFDRPKHEVDAQIRQMVLRLAGNKRHLHWKQGDLRMVLDQAQAMMKEKNEARRKIRTRTPLRFESTERVRRLNARS